MPGILDKVGKPLLLSATRSGLIAGPVAIAYLLLLHFLGEHAFGKFKYMLISIYALFFAFSLWKYRRQQPGARLSVREGLVLGIVLNIVATAVFFGGLYAIMGFSDIGQEMLQVHKQALIVLLEQAKQMGDSIGLTPNDFAQTLVNIQQITGTSLASDQLAFFYGFGVVNTVLMALIFKH